MSSFHHQSFRMFLAVSGTTLALAGCATIPNLGAKPQPAQMDSFATQRSFAAPAVDWVSDRWWDAYGDAQLSALIDQALSRSPSLVEAEARMREADAQVDQSRSALLPSADLEGKVAETESSRAIGFPPQISSLLPKGYNAEASLTFNAAYDLDLFGKNRAALAAAVSEAEAQKADLAQARLTLSTSVAQAYADFARLTAERDAAAEAVQDRLASSKLVSDRVLNGLDTQAELKQAEAATPTSQADVEVLDEQILIARHRIAALVGAGPDYGLELVPPPLEKVRPYGLPADLRVNLVGRRPDIVAARLRAEAAAKQIDVAGAAFYQDISLSGYIGQQALYLQNMFTPAAAMGSLGPALSLPLFEGGRLRGAYRGARANYDAAVAAYNETLITALQDVADAAASVQSAQRQLDERRQAFTAGQAAYNVAELRYKGGLSSYVSVLTAEDAVIEQRRALADAETRAFTLDIALIRALGGGFNGA